MWRTASWTRRPRTSRGGSAGCGGKIPGGPPDLVEGGSALRGGVQGGPKKPGRHGWAVDYLLTHCAPTSIALQCSRHNGADPLTEFLQEIKERARYHYWLFGHYHRNEIIGQKHVLLWEQIVQIV